MKMFKGIYSSVKRGQDFTPLICVFHFRFIEKRQSPLLYIWTVRPVNKNIGVPLAFSLALSYLQKNGHLHALTEHGMSSQILVSQRQLVAWSCVSFLTSPQAKQSDLQGKVKGQGLKSVHILQKDTHSFIIQYSYSGMIPNRNLMF